jgi:hypothetical protein
LPCRSWVPPPVPFTTTAQKHNVREVLYMVVVSLYNFPDHNMNIQARITLSVECVYAPVYLFMLCVTPRTSMLKTNPFFSIWLDFHSDRHLGTGFADWNR